MRLIFFEQVKSEDPNELFDEVHLFDCEADVPPIGTIIYTRDHAYSESNPNNHIEKEVFKVIRIDYLVSNYTNRYELKVHAEILVQKCD